MLAPPVAKPKAMQPQGSKVVARRPSQSAVSQAHMLPQIIGNQAMLRLLAQRSIGIRNEPGIPKKENDVARKAVASPDSAKWFQKLTVGGFGSGGRLPLQHKLRVGSTTDPLEAEADQVAEHVMAEQSVPVSGAGAGSAGVVRRCTCGTCEACGKEKNKRILRHATANVAPIDAPPIVHDVIRSSGRPLDDGLRRDMEGGFGFDFSRVRVHTDGTADAAAQAIGAHAFTTGHNVVFAKGEYAPAQTSGRRLIAHELAHVMQQGGSAEATAPTERPPANVGQYDLAGDTASRPKKGSSSIPPGGLRRVAINRAAPGVIQRAPNQSIDPLTMLTGESDIYAAPISNRPVGQMSKSEVDDEINRIERWIGKQNQSTPDVVQREDRLADLRNRQRELGAPVKAHRATPVVAVKPRCLTESLDISQMNRDEMAAELDSIVRFLRLGPSKSDIAKVTHCKQALEQALKGERELENEEVRRRDVALALQPITTGDPYEDFRRVLTVIASIAPDPNNTAQAALHLPNGMTVPVSNDEATALKTQAEEMIKKYAAQSERLAKDTYEAFEERRKKGKEHPIVHGLVKWAADVDDLDELEMFGKKEQARAMQARIKVLVNSGKLIPAFDVSVGLEMWAEGYARQVGEWEAALMSSAGRWVLGLTILKEGLTLLATAGAGSLISSARTARGVSALRATAEVAGATTFAGTAGAVGGYAASETLTGGEITRAGVVKSVRVGSGTGLAIGAGPGAVLKAREAFGVGKAATTLSNVGRGIAADIVANTPVNVVATGIQGGSIKDAAISTVTSSTISGAGTQAVARIAKGNKVVSTVLGGGVGGTAATAGALSIGKDKRDTIIAGAFGVAGGALGPHLEESNRRYLEGRSGGSSREGAPKPPTTDERFDFSDQASGGGARSEASTAPAGSGVSGKFDLSDVGGSPPAEPEIGPTAVTTDQTGGTPTSSVPSRSSAPALTGSRRTSFGGPNEPPLPADADIEGAVGRLGAANVRPSGSQSRTGYSRTALTSEEEIASAAGRTRRWVSAIDRGRGARPRYANDPVRPKMTMRVATPTRRGFSDVGEAIEEATGGTGAATRSPSEQETLGGAARRPEIDDPGLAQPQRLRSEPSLGGGAEAARAAGLPSEIVDSGYVYTRHDLPDVVPEAVFAGARPPRQTPELADERTRGVAGRRPTAAPDPRDVQNATLNADLRLIEDHVARLNRNAPPGGRWTVEDLRINRGQVAEGPAGLIRASRHTRPDLQFTIRDPAGRTQRFLIEYDRSPPSRSLDHARGILQRDPTAIVILKVIGFE